MSFTYGTRAKKKSFMNIHIHPCACNRRMIQTILSNKIIFVTNWIIFQLINIVPKQNLFLNKKNRGFKQILIGYLFASSLPYIEF